MAVRISERGKFLKRFMIWVPVFLVLCSVGYLAHSSGPVRASGLVSVQCGHTYSGEQLDFSNIHRSGHAKVAIQLLGSNSATVTCPTGLMVGKVGGYAAQTNRGTCNGTENFELITNYGQYADCFFGVGSLSVYITQIDREFWFNTIPTTIAYTPPGQHWFYCYDYNTVGNGSNDGLINLINIDNAQGGYCPNPLP